MNKRKKIIIITITIVVISLTVAILFFVKSTSKEVGDYLKFGSYEQDNSTDNGKEKIEWLILDKKDNELLIISKYALDAMPYNAVYDSVMWDSCSLRTWLNDTFLNEAFSEDEQSKILTTKVFSAINVDYFTEDKIFLLNIEEVNDYFVSDEERKCLTSEYAIAQGVYAYDGYCSWWLRTPGRNKDTALFVFYDGTVDNFGINVSFDNYGVRPVMWISLDGN